MKKIIFFILWHVLSAHATFAFDRQDTLRGSNGRGRSWWDVQHYTLQLSFDTARKSIDGSVTVKANIIAPPGDSLQLDLQELMFLDSVVMDGQNLDLAKERNVFWVKHPFNSLPVGHALEFTAYYHGRPRIAKNPPWDGGFIWTKDSVGNPWIAVACQGLGASAWWPCKDYQGDEPDSGFRFQNNAEVTISRYISPSFDTVIIGTKDTVMFSEGRTVVDWASIIANGRQLCDTVIDDNMDLKIVNLGLDYDSVLNSRSMEGKIVRCLLGGYKSTNPINTYNATFYIGDYVSWTDTVMGEKGKLDLSFHALRYNESRARQQFAVTKQMLHCFEYWMGPYPFYEDGYRLVEAPYLGMEHQSAVAYGNKYKMGYLGTDRSGTGIGLLFDFIIVHESGHEWFGNNITAQDVADNWLHEGFTTYTETLFAECAFGKEKAFEYTMGKWNLIINDKPVIGPYGVHEDGSGDMYNKGAAVVHMIRMVMNDDEKFRQLLRGLNRDFYHQIVTSAQVEEYISKFAGYDFVPLFNQYLRTTQIPRLQWHIKDKKLYYRFVDAVAGFSLPLRVTTGKKSEVLTVTTEWQTIKAKRGFDVSFQRGYLYTQ